MTENISKEIQDKLNERIQLYKDAARLKKTHRTLISSNFFAWIVYDSGQKLNVAYRDYQMRKDILIKFHEKYGFDLYMDYLSRNPVLISDALGSGLYVLDDEIFSVSLKDFSLMEPEDYDDLIKIYAEDKGEGFGKFLWKKIVPRKYEKLLEPGAKERLKKAALATRDYFDYLASISKILHDRFGIPIYLETFALPTYYEALINNYRGMRGVSIDLRRIPEKVKALCAAHGLGPYFEKYMATTQKGSNPDTCADIVTAILGHTFLSKRQFQEIYWPGFEKLFQFIEEKDKILYIFVEGGFSRFYEFMNEAPRGRVVLQVEMDNPFEMKKALGDKVGISGGMPCNLLYNGTVKENIAYAKRLIDELSPGYIFSMDKMVSYPIDCKAENLKAVNDFVRDYRP
jgi:hypothetical protein